MNAMSHKIFHHWCLAIHKEGEWHTAGRYFQYTLVDTGPAFPIRLDCRYGDDGLACRELPRHIEGE